MNRKAEMKKAIHQLDFAIHELVLYLDSHPTSAKAMALLKEYRKLREKAVAAFEERYGKYICDVSDVPPGACWEWLKSPWPWEIGFMEE